MKRHLVVIGALLVAAPMAQAQVNSQCPSGNAQQLAAQDACQKALDLFAYMAPQLGTVIVGGNPILGQGGALGGLPHFTVQLRGTAVAGSLPRVDQITPSPTGAQQSTIETGNQILGLPAVDASIGLFGGLPLGLTRVGGVDLLLSAFYLPDFDGNGVSVAATDGNLKIGYGARIGLVQESLLVPGVSATWMRRDLPSVNLRAATMGGGELAVDTLSMETTSWRVMASKSLVFFGLAVGGGQDRYETGAAVSASIANQTSDRIAARQVVTRTSYFANASMGLVLAKIVGEVGMVRGGEVQTYNEFDGRAADASRLYGSLGVRIGF